MDTTRLLSEKPSTTILITLHGKISIQKKVWALWNLRVSVSMVCMDPYDAAVTVQFVRDPDVDDDSFYIYSVWLSIMYEEDSPYEVLLSDYAVDYFIETVYNGNTLNDNIFS